VRYSTGVWFSGLLVWLALAVIFGLRYSGGHLPRHAGYYIGAAWFLGGLGLGWRALWWPVAASFAYGLSHVLLYAFSSREQDQPHTVILYFTYYPLIFMVPVAVGAAIRAVALLATRRR